MEKFKKHFDQIFKIFWTNFEQKKETKTKNKIWENFEETSRKFQNNSSDMKKKLWKFWWNYRKIRRHSEIILRRFYRNVNVKYLKKFWGNFETFFLKFSKNCKKTKLLEKFYEHFDEILKIYFGDWLKVKCMGITFFNREGLVYTQTVPDAQTVSGD